MRYTDLVEIDDYINSSNTVLAIMQERRVQMSEVAKVADGLAAAKRLRETVFKGKS